MTPDTEPSTPNLIRERDARLFEELKDFRAQFEEILLDNVDNVLASPSYRDRGNFLPRDDTKAIAQVVRILTSEEWTAEQLEQFDGSWRHAMRSDFFAEAFESIRFRIETAVDVARARVLEKAEITGVTQGTLW
jgi:hypothetical protein